MTNLIDHTVNDVIQIGKDNLTIDNATYRSLTEKGWNGTKSRGLLSMIQKLNNHQGAKCCTLVNDIVNLGILEHLQFFQVLPKP